jgi:hypothetical protein
MHKQLKNVKRLKHVDLFISFYYQPLHNSFYHYMFRLPVVTIIRELLFTDMRSVWYVNEW